MNYYIRTYIRRNAYDNWYIYGSLRRPILFFFFKEIMWEIEKIDYTNDHNGQKALNKVLDSLRQKADQLESNQRIVNALKNTLKTSKVDYVESLLLKLKVKR